ncbi:TasA family protein [Chloroflexota bacterium]
MRLYKNIATLVLVCLLLISLSASTWAFFSNTEDSSTNQLAAGTLDLKTDDVDGVTQTLCSDNMTPGYSVGPATITLKNTGAVNGSTLDIDFDYYEDDQGGGNPISMTADETAGVFEVTTLTYGGSSLLASVSDNNTNGYEDVYDLKVEDLSGQSGINSAASKDFTIEVTMRIGANPDFGKDDINITMTFTLNQ